MLTIGTTSVCITPPIGLELTGFGGRPSGSIGVHDDLYAKALVFDDSFTKIAWVTTDLLSLGFDIVAEIRSRVEERVGIPPAQVMFSSSHTHSGPATITLRGVGDRDPSYVATLIRQIEGAIFAADASRRPAALGYGRSDVQIGINRRERRESTTVLGRNPGRPVSPWVHVLRVDRKDAPGAALFSHAAHPVVLGGENLFVSADYPGYAMRFVERAEGVTALFANGCCGDINSDPARGTFEDARRLGTILGAEVIKTFERVEGRGDLRIRARTETVELPLIDPPPPEEAERALHEHRRALDDQVASGAPPHQTRIPRELIRWAEDMLDLSKRGVTGATQAFEIQGFAFGDEIAVVGLPGEMLVQYALNIERDSPFEHTFVVGYTNGCIGYVPPAADYPDGGYEVDYAYRLYGTQMIAPESERIILEGATRVLERLRSGEA